MDRTGCSDSCPSDEANYRKINKLTNNKQTLIKEKNELNKSTQILANIELTTILISVGWKIGGQGMDSA